MRKAFSIIELFFAIALAGAMAIFTATFFDITAIFKETTKSKFQSDLNLITTAVLQCKELSTIMPIESNGSLANDSNLSDLECNTSTPYALDGGRGYFIPPAPTGFTKYKATQNADEFYIATTAGINTNADDVLKDLNTTYSAQQYVLTHDATTAYLNFYISR